MTIVSDVPNTEKVLHILYNWTGLYKMLLFRGASVSVFRKTTTSTSDTGKPDKGWGRQNSACVSNQRVCAKARNLW